VSDLTNAVRAQIADHPDQAAAALALAYAEALDDNAGEVEVLKDLGPGLLRVLESLALTPKARAAGGPNSSPASPTPAAPSRLEAMRERFGPGQYGTAPVDAAAS
jgi:hypothetical protein